MKTTTGTLVQVSFGIHPGVPQEDENVSDDGYDYLVIRVDRGDGEYHAEEVSVGSAAKAEGSEA